MNTNPHLDSRPLTIEGWPQGGVRDRAACFAAQAIADGIKFGDWLYRKTSKEASVDPDVDRDASSDPVDSIGVTGMATSLVLTGADIVTEGLRTVRTKAQAFLAPIEHDIRSDEPKL